MSLPPLQRPLGRDDPTQIGPYRLLGVLGEGGMSTVYLGEQASPVVRRVAIKALRADLAPTPEQVVRLQVEMEALSRLTHPGITRIYDVGVLAGRGAYFVMELVRGEPITEHADRRRLSVPERVALFLRVCDAVRHAHQQGILHRDLKPANVLVEEQAGERLPKVIDFGLAKVTSEAGRASPTTVGGILGTVDYMSPEQTASGVAAVDTRTDVFGLGATLYELLTGLPPRERRRGETIADTLLRVRDVDAAPASARVGGDGADWGAVAALRRTTPEGLARALRGDLDAILATALRRDPEARYPSVADFALDLRRHLTGDPVSVRLSSPGYRLRRVLLRDRTLAAAVASIVLGAGLASALTTAALLGGLRRVRADDAVVRVSDALQARVASSHLALEERVAGDPSVDVADEVRAPLREAIDLCGAILEGRETSLGAVPSTPEILAEVRGLEGRLRDLLRMTEARVSLGAAAGPGSAADDEYDRQYREILSACLSLAATVDPGRVPVSRAALVGSLVSMTLVGLLLLVRRLVARPSVALPSDGPASPSAPPPTVPA